MIISLLQNIFQVKGNEILYAVNHQHKNYCNIIIIIMFGPQMLLDIVLHASKSDHSKHCLRVRRNAFKKATVLASFLLKLMFSSFFCFLSPAVVDQISEKLRKVWHIYCSAYVAPSTPSLSRISWYNKRMPHIWV